MGSPWDEHRSEDGEHGSDRHGALSTNPGLEAAELDLLRRAPDYDAEEMASVRPAGGWPALLAAPGAAAAPPAPAVRPSPPWLPPNRIEPPVERRAPAAMTPAVAAPVSTRAQFPEERTLALIAEDLLGRPLEEPMIGMPAPGPAAGPPPAGGSLPGQEGARPATGSAAVWDAAMPLVAEG